MVSVVVPVDRVDKPLCCRVFCSFSFSCPAYKAPLQLLHVVVASWCLAAVVCAQTDGADISEPVSAAQAQMLKRSGQQVKRVKLFIIDGRLHI